MYDYMVNHITGTSIELMGRYNIGYIEDNKITESYNKYYLREGSFENLNKIKEKLKDKELKYIPDDISNGCRNIKNDNESNHRSTKYFKPDPDKNKYQYGGNIKNDREYNRNKLDPALYVQTSSINKSKRLSKELLQMPSKSYLSNSEQPI